MRVAVYTSTITASSVASGTGLGPPIHLYCMEVEADVGLACGLCLTLVVKHQPSQASELMRLLHPF
jgi:hypothetical protein